MEESTFIEIINKYGKDAIIHITGGEPSLCTWLYPLIERHNGIKFHLNTNAFIAPPRNIKRLKVSLDTHKKDYFNELTSRDSFDRVVNNIKLACSYTVTSITCTLTRENYRDAPVFMRFCRDSFPGLYAVFFSIYKGNKARFAFQENDVEKFFNETRQLLQEQMDKESLSLFMETIDEKRRLLEGVRFPENGNGTCYLSMSERVFDTHGNAYNCSHLFRDGIMHKTNEKHSKCLYGCNRRLVEFNRQVSTMIIPKAV
jgi:MoaA/NifB/PqqE/SkfB family radical SAM enzyme